MKRKSGPGQLSIVQLSAKSLTAFGENAEKFLFANCNELVLGHSPGKSEDGDDDRNIKDSDK